ncbi:MAG TPA: YebC/PmpR family DNA-binding transcriptional regulator [Bacilli bacterium]|nr:YebC/PmpR family DNA-binding transcriptional regulator [Bacilli bacterium]
MGRAYEVRKASIAKTGAAKAKIYSNYAKEIYSVAKAHGTDPNGNLTLKHLIEKAKKEQVPQDIIKRALDKVNSGVDETYTQLRYEGFLPENITVIVDCLTDNVNRTISYVRNAFTKCSGKLGINGSVIHTYNNYSVVVTDKLNEDEVLETLLNDNIDVKDVIIDDYTTIYGLPEDLYKIKESIKKIDNNIEFIVDEVSLIPIDKVKPSKDTMELFNRLINMLDEIEDVQNVYHNVDETE